MIINLMNIWRMNKMKPISEILEKIIEELKIKGFRT